MWIALILALTCTAGVQAARDPEDLTKLLQDADRALAEPDPAPTPTPAPEQPFNNIPQELSSPNDSVGDPQTETMMDPPPTTAGDDIQKEDVPAVSEVPAAPSVPAVSQYKVWIWQESGDTLWRIAQKVYGDKDKWRLIYLANKDVIKDPNKIYPKQKLKIPPADWQP